jgi:hypothetical protein
MLAKWEKILIVSFYTPPLGNKDIFLSKLKQLLLTFINTYDMVFYGWHKYQNGRRKYS